VELHFVVGSHKNQERLLQLETTLAKEPARQTIIPLQKNRLKSKIELRRLRSIRQKLELRAPIQGPMRLILEIYGLNLNQGQKSLSQDQQQPSHLKIT